MNPASELPLVKASKKVPTFKLNVKNTIRITSNKSRQKSGHLLA